MLKKPSCLMESTLSHFGSVLVQGSSRSAAPLLLPNVLCRSPFVVLAVVRNRLLSVYCEERARTAYCEIGFTFNIPKADPAGRQRVAAYVRTASLRGTVRRFTITEEQLRAVGLLSREDCTDGRPGLGLTRSVFDCRDLLLVGWPSPWSLFKAWRPPLRGKSLCVGTAVVKNVASFR